MSFRFSLATVLRLREIAEEREERLLGRISSQIAQARENLDNVQIQYADLLRRRELELERRMAAAELHISYGQMRALEEMQKNTQDELDKLEALRGQQLKAYEVAHRNRELLEGMREEQLQLFHLEQVRQNQKTMDDVFASRRPAK